MAISWHSSIRRKRCSGVSRWSNGAVNLVLLLNTIVDVGLANVVSI
jgi:hypothetical protein